jgi:hypothetical protein
VQQQLRHLWLPAVLLLLLERHLQLPSNAHQL